MQTRRSQPPKGWRPGTTRSAAGAGDLDDAQTRKEKLESLNLAILIALTASPPNIQLAYELGRSLRDTANPPDGTAKGLAVQLGHARIAKLQDWLVTLSPEFPQLTTAVVAGSLGRWSDLASVTVGTNATVRARITMPGLRRLPPEDERTSIAKSLPHRASAVSEPASCGRAHR